MFHCWVLAEVAVSIALYFFQYLWSFLKPKRCLRKTILTFQHWPLCCPGAMPVCTLVRSTAARRSVDTPTTFVPRRSWSKRFWLNWQCMPFCVKIKLRKLYWLYGFHCSVAGQSVFFIFKEASLSWSQVKLDSWCAPTLDQHLANLCRLSAIVTSVWGTRQLDRIALQYKT